MLILLQSNQKIPPPPPSCNRLGETLPGRGREKWVILHGPERVCRVRKQSTEPMKMKLYIFPIPDFQDILADFWGTSFAGLIGAGHINHISYSVVLYI